MLSVTEALDVVFQESGKLNPKIVAKNYMDVLDYVLAEDVHAK